jgi:RNA methyltransferase, TrmH family
VKRITSRHNPLVARYRATARGDVRDLLLLDGAHLVAEALDAGIRLQHAAVVAEASADVAALASRLRKDGVQVVDASASVMDALSPVRSSSAIVALADRPPDAVRALDVADRTGRALVVIASGVQDPGNVGAVVRVAEAGGAAAVIATGGSADPFGWKALRGSMGSALRLPIISGIDTADALADLRRRGYRSVATTPRGGRSIFEADLSGATAIVIGGEGAGLDQAVVDAADERVTIPMEPPVESLNAAVTAAIIIYEARRQRMQAGGLHAAGRRN